MTAANTEKSSNNFFKPLKMKIELDHKTASEMELHAEATYPFECCGFLFGDDAGSRTISHAATPKRVTGTGASKLHRKTTAVRNPMLKNRTWIYWVYTTRIPITRPYLLNMTGA